MTGDVGLGLSSAHPIPGGYEVCEEPGLPIQRLGEVRREEARLQEK